MSSLNYFSRNLRFKSLVAATRSTRRELTTDEDQSEPNTPPSDSNNRLNSEKELLLSIGAKLGISDKPLSSWYNISTGQLLEHGGQKLLSDYNYSMRKLLSTVFSEHKWDPNFFVNRAPGAVWTSPVNLRGFLLNLGRKLGIKEGDYYPWLQLTQADFRKHGGLPLLKNNGYDYTAILKKAFPEHRWTAAFRSMKKRKTDYYWHSLEVQKEFVAKLGHKLGIKEGDYAAWYRVSSKEFLNGEGSTLLAKVHQGSRQKLFSTVFPEHKWFPWFFKKTKRDFSRLNAYGLKQLQEFAQELERLLCLKQPEDWYTITREDFTEINLGYLFERQSDFLRFLEKAYPNINWKVEKLAWASLGWSNLRSVLEQLFPEGAVPASNHFRGAKLKSPSLKTVMVVPKHKLLFEYQPPSLYAKQIVEMRPDIKLLETSPIQELADSEGLKLISIPFWWGRDTESILSELWALTPEMFEENGPLWSLRESASSPSSARIPRSIPLPEINPGYVRRWAIDPRFKALFS